MTDRGMGGRFMTDRGMGGRLMMHADTCRGVGGRLVTEIVARVVHVDL